MKSYKKYKRPTFGQCNICRSQATLTWDHVPPKGGIVVRAVEIESIQDFLTKSTSPKEISQNGVKYRTICKKCNETLGSRYDPTLNEWNRKIANFLRSALHLPAVIKFETYPTALARAVLGHLLAGKLTIDDSKTDKLIRSFLFDDSKPIPDDIHIFYWIYPYDYQLVLRDFAILKVIHQNKIIARCDLLKFFPVAYLVTDRSQFDGLPSLTDYRQLNPNEVVEIPVPLNKVRKSDWPEKVDEQTVLFMGQAGFESISAKPRSLKLK
jgi:hypothetical protein